MLMCIPVASEHERVRNQEKTARRTRGPVKLELGEAGTG